MHKPCPRPRAATLMGFLTVLAFLGGSCTCCGAEVRAGEPAPVAAAAPPGTGPESTPGAMVMPVPRPPVEGADQTGTATALPAGEDGPAPPMSARPDGSVAGTGDGNIYLCPMHPRVIHHEPGRCPICGMDLVARPAAGVSGGAGARMVPMAMEPASSRAEPVRAAPAADALYVCPMHPEVTRHEPGRCPICGMDLVLRTTGAAPAHDHGDGHTTPADGGDHRPPGTYAAVSVPDAVVNQLGVRTVPVRRGELERHIEGYGVFLRASVRAARPTPVGTEPEPLAAGGPTTVLMVLGQVFEREAPLVRPGQFARVRFPSLGAREWHGSVSSLESQINQTTHTLPIRIAVEPEDAVIPGGMSALVTVLVDPLRDVLLVPREAVIVTGKGSRVVVALDGGRFQPREVVAEDLGEDEIVIRSGLDEGEKVVVSAQFLLDSEANLQTGLMRLDGSPPAGPREVMP